MSHCADPGVGGAVVLVVVPPPVSGVYSRAATVRPRPRREHVPVGSVCVCARARPPQLLSYYIADLRKCSVDQPRNLAKSVTVE